MPLTNPTGENVEADDYLDDTFNIISEYERLGLIDPNSYLEQSPVYILSGSNDDISPTFL